MDLVIGRLALVFALLTVPAAAWAHPQMTPWDRDHPVAAELGPFRLSWSRVPRPRDEGDEAILHVTDPQGRKADLKAVIAFDDVSASLGVGRIDPESPKPQLLLTSYTGGAHCCVHIQLLDFIAGGWRVVDVGVFDGEPFTDFPADVDGDGVVDIQHWDDRFAYAFGCYACSWMPPRLFDILGGEVRDVSAAPRFSPLYARDYRRAKEQCRKHENPACAGMVADGYRLGRANEAWAVAMANVDVEDSWILPGCKLKAPVGRCPEAEEYRASDFRRALAQFLTDIGIAPSPGP
jgi:hypothetical protein